MTTTVLEPQIIRVENPVNVALAQAVLDFAKQQHAHIETLMRAVMADNLADLTAAERVAQRPTLERLATERVIARADQASVAPEVEPARMPSDLTG